MQSEKKLLPERCCVCFTLQLASDCLHWPLIWGQVRLSGKHAEACSWPAAGLSSRPMLPHHLAFSTGLWRAAPARFRSRDLHPGKAGGAKSKAEPEGLKVPGLAATSSSMLAVTS